MDVAAYAVVKLGGGHQSAELRLREHGAEIAIGVEKDVVIEEDVVDPDHSFFAQHRVIEKGRAVMKLQTDAEMSVVVEVGAGGNHPIDEAVLNQGNQASPSLAGWRQGAAERNPDGAVVQQHFLRVQAAGFAQPAGVVGGVDIVDQVRQGGLCSDRIGKNPVPAQQLGAALGMFLLLRFLRCRL